MGALPWFDGHLDLGCIAQLGRDMSRPAEEATGGQLPAAVTFPALDSGNVRAALATIFVQRLITPEEAKRRSIAPENGPWCYSDIADAPRAARSQIALYDRWHQAGILQNMTRPDSPCHPVTLSPGHAAPLKVVLLLEGAAGVQSPEQFQEFYDAGVRVVSLTWNEGSPYAGGDQSGGDVTGAGKKLLAELDRRGIIHDVSHLSERAFWTVMEQAGGIKVASHSNCRALLPEARHPERHLSDAQIRALAKSPGSVIGMVLYSRFLVSRPGARASLADVLAHMCHIEQLTGRRDILALGSDMDGGFSRDLLPSDLDSPQHLQRLAEALSSAGWSDADILHFAWKNWCQTLQRVEIQI